MDGGLRHGPRLVEGLVVTFVLATWVVFALSRVIYFGASWRIAAYVAVAALIAALQLVHSSTRRRRGGLVRYTLPLQALLTYLPYFYFGESWVGLPPFLAGSMLVLVRGRAGWVLFAVVVGSSALFGGGYGGGVEGAWYCVLSTVNVSLALYGLSSLGGQVARVAATREELARAAVAAERLRASSDLDRSIGRGLEAIASHGASAAAARSTAGTAAATARVLRVARTALQDARAVAAAYRTTSRAAGASDDGAAGRLALRVLLVVYAMYFNAGAQFLVATDGGPVEWAVSAGSVLGILLLQLRHVALRLRGRPVGGQYATFTAQMVLAYVPLAVPGVYWFMPVGLVAASALLLLPRRTAWTMCAAILASMPLLAPLGSVPLLETADGWVSAVGTGTVIYGLIWLVELTAELRSARAELARMAVLAERLRVAGDVHDLLGYGLSAITLKTELAQRLLPTAPDRARKEMDEVARLARDSLGELHHLAAGTRALSFTDEARSARTVLTALDIDATVATPAAPLCEQADAALAAVLREAVTNVLRHSTARHVTIGTTAEDGVVRLQVTNDGIRRPPPQPTHGTGIASMAARVEALGGRLTTGADPSGRFRLTAEIPCPGHLSVTARHGGGPGPHHPRLPGDIRDREAHAQDH